MWIVIRGGGDLASGVALRLRRCSLQILITELPQPLVVRRRVAFAEAVYDGRIAVEGVVGRRMAELELAQEAARRGEIPVLVDPDGAVIERLRLAQAGRLVVVDARMTKRPPEPFDLTAAFVIGLGPGFNAGQNCHAVIETNRGHSLGRVIWAGPGEPDTGVPERVGAHGAERVLRAPAAGRLHCRAEIGQRLQAGQVIAEVAGQPVLAPFEGVLRGLLRSGLEVTPGLKIGDVDPRNDPQFCSQVSDKSLAVGGGVLEALLSQSNLRPWLWE